MSDVYHAYYTDTMRALVKFNEATSGLEVFLSDMIADAIGDLNTEVEMLLEEYKRAIEKIESLNEELKELEGQKCQE